MYNGPKRKQKQCLRMQNLGGQTKSIMVFSEVACYHVANTEIIVISTNSLSQPFP